VEGKRSSPTTQAGLGKEGSDEESRKSIIFSLGGKIRPKTREKELPCSRTEKKRKQGRCKGGEKGKSSVLTFGRRAEKRRVMFVVSLSKRGKER